MALLVSCAAKQTGTSSDTVASAPPSQLPDTLRIGTLYGPGSYFLYRDEEMGYEYELITRFAKDSGLPYTITVASNFNDLMNLLESGQVDILAYDVPMTSEYKERVLFCGQVNETHQVLVQQKGDSIVSDVTQLPGKDVYVEPDTKYYYRLQNLSKELGGGIHVHPVKEDSVDTEDLIEKVSMGEIPFTVIDSDIAKFSSTYYDNLDVSLPVGMEQRGSWAVAKTATALAEAVQRWADNVSVNDVSKEIYRRYYVDSKRLQDMTEEPVAAPLVKGQISQYDAIFKKYASELDWDWRLLAAQAYEESRFDVTQVSWAGARGLMQLMPKTASANGLSQENITDPELNVKAAVKVIQSLDKTLSSKVPDDAERLKFILAGYNSGIAHILDAIALAEKLGLNPRVWNGNVRDALLLKSKPEYYHDPVVKYGYFKGTQTVEYVDKVLKTFDRYKSNA